MPNDTYKYRLNFHLRSDNNRLPKFSSYFQAYVKFSFKETAFKVFSITLIKREMTDTRSGKGFLPSHLPSKRHLVLYREKNVDSGYNT